MFTLSHIQMIDFCTPISSSLNLFPVFTGQLKTRCRGHKTFVESDFTIIFFYVYQNWNECFLPFLLSLRATAIELHKMFC